MGVKYSTRINDTTNFIKMRFFVFFCLLIAAASAQRRAPSRSKDLNCNCQCTDYSRYIRGEDGVLRGNCETEANGALWCFVDDEWCNDRVPWQNRYWSTEACTTLDRGVCGFFQNWLRKKQY